MSEQVKTEMNPMQRIISVFSAPKKLSESIKEKPTWLVPFLITMVITIILNIMAMDIGFQDQIDKMVATDTPAAAIERVEGMADSPLRYLNMLVIPIATLFMWVVSAFFLWLGSNTVLGGESTFKQNFSLTAWTGLILMVGAILKTALILANGTTIGVSTSLAMLMETPEIGKTGSLLYQIMSKLDFFVIWQMITWVIGVSVLNRFSTNKSTGLVIVLFVFGVIVSIIWTKLTGGMMG